LSGSSNFVNGGISILRPFKKDLSAFSLSTEGLCNKA
jgi:hypothetical protein